jgi:hypothetical protein
LKHRAEKWTPVSAKAMRRKEAGGRRRLFLAHDPYPESPQLFGVMRWRPRRPHATDGPEQNSGRRESLEA